MKNIKVLLLTFVLFSPQLLASEEYLDKKTSIKNQLSEMVRVDQDIRSTIDWTDPDPSLLQEMINIDKQNTKVLKKILHSYCWITISEFGEKADHNAWFLVQHADHDVAFQKEALSRLEKLYPLGETNAKNFAYLYDRIAIKENRPQRYGTQGTMKENKWIAYPIEAPSRLDDRRKAVGLPPFKEYLNQIKSIYVDKPK